MPLSNRIRPDCEAAPWVIEEVKKLEAQLKTFERADNIEANSFEERCSEASYYTWLDDQNMILKKEIHRLNDIMSSCEYCYEWTNIK